MYGFFYLVKFNVQYFSKLNRYFHQVVGDFGPHQTALDPPCILKPFCDEEAHFCDALVMSTHYTLYLKGLHYVVAGATK